MKKIEGAADLYEMMVELNKNIINMKAFPLRKNDAKNANIKWSFVEESAKLLNLKVIKSGSGYLIAKDGYAN